MDSAGGVESPEAGRAPAPVALDFSSVEASSSSSSSSSPEGRIPRRIRRRFMESAGRSAVPSSVEEIEAKLREADLRRQQFHDWLSSKARPKPRSPSWSSQEEDLGQRLEARLNAAEQKRLDLLAKAQRRLAKLDELRQAAKIGVEKRFEKEREELGTRVEYRVQQAEANRMRLLKAHMQRRAAAQERKARSLSQRVIRENKYKECVRSAISQKRAAAEKKRIGLLEAEKKRAHARVVKAYKVAKIVCNQRESERRRLKEQLDNRLQRAKRQRAEYLKQRGSPHTSARIMFIKHGDNLSRKLARCWRSFVRSRRTTFSLAQPFEALGLSEISVKSMPFEQLALLIESSTTLETTKALLDRLESRFFLLLSSGSSSTENIDHLLKHLATPKRRTPPGRVTRTKGGSKKGAIRESRSSRLTKPSRYPVRVVLCAYMILGHPNAVFSDHGEREAALRESAVNFVREFESLIKVIVDGTRSHCASRQSSPDMTPHDSSADFPCNKSFRSQLSVFDEAWRSYLSRFVVWKIKDAKSLEEDLVRAACQLELSMMQTCKLTSSGESRDLSHDMRAIQKQVTEDQKLLREKVLHLSGDAGIERMECALSDTRTKYFGAMESGNLATPVAHISSPSSSHPLEKPLVSDPHLPSPTNTNSSISAPKEQTAGSSGRTKHVVRSLFGSGSSLSSNVVQTVETTTTQSTGEKPPTENELVVNEILHLDQDTSVVMDVDESDTKVKVKEMMEKAFWDSVMESAKEDKPNFGRIVGLVKEIRDELVELAPQSWKQEILDSIDLDIVSQVFCSGTEDMDYLGKVLQYMLSMLQKLSAPANEEEMMKVHQRLLGELRDMAQSDDKPEGSFYFATIKGLRFVLEQIQKLKKEVSKAHIQLIEPIIKGSAGLEYLQKAFADRYGAPSGARTSLPLTLQWISTIKNDSLEEEWDDYTDSRSVSSPSHGLPPATALRSGGARPRAVKQDDHIPDRDELPECKGEEIDKVIRLGLLKLASTIEGVTEATVPETLKLNVLRLRSVQSQLQQIIVIATSALILRQILISENSAASPSALEGVVSATVKALSELLPNAPDVGIEEIIDTMVKSSSSYATSLSEAKIQSRKETMTRLLLKSLQNNDAVFSKVSHAVYLAARGVVLGGTGSLGQGLADAALRRVGASMLLEPVVKAGEMLLTMALITTRVHGSWYRYLV